MQQIYVGSFQMIVKDSVKGVEYPVLIHYPTYKISKPTAFGSYTMDVSVNASIIEGKFPLLIISHGNGGSHLLYRTISTYLAKKGFVVAMLEHYGNNRNDNILENTIENLQLRPRHIRLTIDAVLTEFMFCNSIIISKIAVIGHSMGGYAALALAGGIPRTLEGDVVETETDSRVKAIVLMAPGAGWFKNALHKVVIPILMFTAENDFVTPSWNADIVLQSVPDAKQVSHKIIANAGHFSFLSPFPEKMKSPTFLPSTDPAGFDRGQFHTQLPVDICKFLQEKL